MEKKNQTSTTLSKYQLQKLVLNLTETHNYNRNYSLILFIVLIFTIVLSEDFLFSTIWLLEIISILFLVLRIQKKFENLEDSEEKTKIAEEIKNYLFQKGTRLNNRIRDIIQPIGTIYRKINKYDWLNRIFFGIAFLSILLSSELIIFKILPQLHTQYPISFSYVILFVNSFLFFTIFQFLFWYQNIKNIQNYLQTNIDSYFEQIDNDLEKSIEIAQFEECEKAVLKWFITYRGKIFNENPEFDELFKDLYDYYIAYEGQKKYIHILQQIKTTVYNAFYLEKKGNPQSLKLSHYTEFMELLDQYIHELEFEIAQNEKEKQMRTEKINMFNTILSILATFLSIYAVIN